MATTNPAVPAAQNKAAPQAPTQAGKRKAEELIDKTKSSYDESFSEDSSSSSEDSSSSSEESSSSSEEFMEKVLRSKTKSSSDESSSSSEESSSSSEEYPSSSSEEESSVSPCTPKEQTTKSKTLYVCNLAFNAETSHIAASFKYVGDVVVRHGSKGYAFVEFATPKAALQALNELNNQILLGRRVRLYLYQAAESSTSAPSTSTTASSSQKRQGLAVFVRGFRVVDDNNQPLSEHQIISSLTEHFGGRDKVKKISMINPKTSADVAVEGACYIHLNNADAYLDALEKNDTMLQECTLYVDHPDPNGD